MESLLRLMYLVMEKNLLPRKGFGNHLMLTIKCLTAENFLYCGRKHLKAGRCSEILLTVMEKNNTVEWYDSLFFLNLINEEKNQQFFINSTTFNAVVLSVL